ncbi:MAG: haloacid dehalogenase type II [Actinomycetota bacterium]|nr:haloacid dehalogenase type II [Actinomycetota bacterium]
MPSRPRADAECCPTPPGVGGARERIRRSTEEVAVAGRVQLVVLDVNETLSDMEPLRERFTSAGAPASLLDTWFASTLRDGFALAAAGAAAPFPKVGAGVLRALLTPLPDLAVPVDEAVDNVLAGFPELDLHPDVADGLRLLADAGVRLVTLTNGSATLSARLFDRAGLNDLLERRMSVDDAGRWKPHRRAYESALDQCGVAADRAAMVAVHPWDTDGAKRAGLLSAYVDRRGMPYPDVFLAPDVTGPDLPSVARALLEL